MGVGEAFGAGPQRSRSAQVEHALRREIVLGTLPPGGVLRELDLAQRFAVAQGTIREALMRLSEEGLVQRRARRDTHVTEAHSDDVVELLRIRHDIECRAALRVIEANDPRLRKDLDMLLQAMRLAALQEDEYALLEQDCRFHLRLFEAAAMPVVEPVLMRCLLHTQRFKILNSAAHSRELLATADRHVSILEALETRSAEALMRALSHHIATIVDFGPEVMPPLAPETGQGVAGQAAVGPSLKVHP
ncbi:GntR family transcriptional regulator [Cereibacter sphaeroides]|nr:GntR family transcriptional regulator [Cereibacter sphaeroides]RDS94912.1 GntR family transcriptional regulator [Cereibacter sphaeroides f. sp. denitrificans]